MVALSIVAAPHLVELLLTERWRDVTPLLQVLLGFAWVRALQGVATPVVLGLGAPREQARLAALELAALALVLPAALESWGILGAGVATLTSGHTRGRPHDPRRVCGDRSQATESGAGVRGCGPRREPARLGDPAPGRFLRRPQLRRVHLARRPRGGRGRGCPGLVAAASARLAAQAVVRGGLRRRECSPSCVTTATLPNVHVSTKLQSRQGSPLWGLRDRPESARRTFRAWIAAPRALPRCDASAR